MHVLVAARYHDFSVKLIEKLKKEGQSVVFVLLGGEAPSMPGGVKVFRPPLSPAECHNICRNYSFSAAFFLTSVIDSGDIEVMSLEMSIFQTILSASKWKHVILQSDCHLFEIDPNNPAYTMKKRDRNTAETQIVLHEIFFQSYCAQNQIPLAILRTGYIYDPNSETSSIAALLSGCGAGTPLALHPEDDVNLLYMGDALEAFKRCLSDAVTGIYNVCAAQWMSAASLFGQYPGCRLLEAGPRQITSDRDTSEFFFPSAYADFKQRTDWIPLTQFHGDLQPKPDWQARVKKNAKPWTVVFNKRLKPLMETLAGFLIATLLQSLPSNIASLSGFDTLIVFITLIACKYGVGMGFLASLLGCVSHYYNHIGMNSSLTDILFISNLWLPFVVYLLLGMVLGYWRKLRNEESDALRESLKIMDRKYSLLSELHEDTLRAKDMLKEQIFNFEDSFGRVAQMTEQLSSLQSEKVLAATIRVFDQAIHVGRIAVYALSADGRYARLAICSNGLNEVMQSIDLTANPLLKLAIEENNLYMSRELSGGISYACPMFDEGRRAMYFIALYGCSLQQFTLAFQNQFRVVCSLVQNSLLRALHYEQATWQQRHVGDTHVLNAEAFRERMLLLESEDTMESKWLIFKIAAPADIKSLNRSIAPMLRKHDFIGIGVDGCVYAVFLWARNEDSHGIIRRMGNAGVILWPITDKKELITA